MYVKRNVFKFNASWTGLTICKYPTVFNRQLRIYRLSMQSTMSIYTGGVFLKGVFGKKAFFFKQATMSNYNRSVLECADDRQQCVTCTFTVMAGKYISQYLEYGWSLMPPLNTILRYFSVCTCMSYLCWKPEQVYLVSNSVTVLFRGTLSND